MSEAWVKDCDTASRVESRVQTVHTHPPRDRRSLPPSGRTTGGFALPPSPLPSVTLTAPTLPTSRGRISLTSLSTTGPLSWLERAPHTHCLWLSSSSTHCLISVSVTACLPRSAAIAPPSSLFLSHTHHSPIEPRARAGGGHPPGRGLQRHPHGAAAGGRRSSRRARPQQVERAAPRGVARPVRCGAGATGGGGEPQPQGPLEPHAAGVRVPRETRKGVSGTP